MKRCTYRACRNFVVFVFTGLGVFSCKTTPPTQGPNDWDTDTLTVEKIDSISAWVPEIPRDTIANKPAIPSIDSPFTTSPNKTSPRPNDDSSGTDSFSDSSSLDPTPPPVDRPSPLKPVFTDTKERKRDTLSRDSSVSFPGLINSVLNFSDLMEQHLVPAAGDFARTSEVRDVRLRTSWGLLDGKIAYAIPDSMDVGKLARVAIMVSGKQVLNVQKLKLGVAGLGSLPGRTVEPEEVPVESIMAGERMKARLSDPNRATEANFKITPLGDSVQALLVQKDSVALWQWDVTALKEGAHPLNLQLEALLEEGGLTQNIPVFTKVVIVVSERNTWAQYVGIGGAAALVLGLVVFFWKRKSRSPSATLAPYMKHEDLEAARAQIVKGRIREAFATLENKTINATKSLKNKLVIKLQDYNEYKDALDKDMITREEFNRETNKITHILLDTLHELEEASKAGKHK